MIRNSFTDDGCNKYSVDQCRSEWIDIKLKDKTISPTDLKQIDTKIR